MSNLEARMDALEARTKAAEDELAIIRLVASYGPLVDCGSLELAPALFGDDGIYDLSYGRTKGADEFSQLLRGPDHQGILAQGIAHVMGLPWVRVDGDEAVAINCTQLYLRDVDGDGYTIFRVAQNTWKLSRTHDGGWTIRERLNRLIGDNGEARELLLATV
jgi:hypothetical protein